MMWTRGRLLSRPFCSWACVCLKKWTHPVLLSSAVALLMTAPGCSSLSSTPKVPSLPVLISLQRLELNGVSGVWMDSSDAGRLAQWIYDVTGEAGR